jgi:hypothetical protein
MVTVRERPRLTVWNGDGWPPELLFCVLYYVCHQDRFLPQY